MSYIRDHQREAGKREVQLFLYLRATELAEKETADRDRVRHDTPGVENDRRECGDHQNASSWDSNVHFMPSFSSAASNCSARQGD